ncbi:MAG: class I SAM-dependent RNA methyltransferase [Lachnospiraceae bacterium]|nr:class I SAM-dependent RNA methyltransferase [Lachnospiraceae bacterium]
MDVNSENSIKNIETNNYLENKIVFDLYSGTGTIAQIIAPIAKKVVGVEIVEEAVEAAKRNAEYNRLGNCEFIAGDVLKVLEEIDEKPDFIILDPPRDGLNPKALKKICEEIKVPGMVYISCKPTSLARDIGEMQKYGYNVRRVCCVDMFPQTGHVETVVGLQRKDT